ncbi:MAG: hypothetical protein E6X87_10705 [Lachnospiraceae bacterium]|nr:hypothetical protein [Lachnospiraceae bacterium]
MKVLVRGEKADPDDDNNGNDNNGGNDNNSGNNNNGGSNNGGNNNTGNNGGSSNGGSHNNGSTSGSHSQSVQTGDNANVIMWAVLLSTSGGSSSSCWRSSDYQKKEKIIKTESETRYTDSSYMGIRISYFSEEI